MFRHFLFHTWRRLRRLLPGVLYAESFCLRSLLSASSLRSLRCSHSSLPCGQNHSAAGADSPALQWMLGQSCSSIDLCLRRGGRSLTLLCGRLRIRSPALTPTQVSNPCECKPSFLGENRRDFPQRVPFSKTFSSYSSKSNSVKGCAGYRQCK